MERVGACQHDAAMASFSSLPQARPLRQPWQARDELRAAIVFWIERTPHRRRRQQTLGRLTPIGFEILHQAAHEA